MNNEIINIIYLYLHYDILSNDLLKRVKYDETDQQTHIYYFDPFFGECTTHSISSRYGPDGYYYGAVIDDFISRNLRGVLRMYLRSSFP